MCEYGWTDVGVTVGSAIVRRLWLVLHGYGCWWNTWDWQGNGFDGIWAWHVAGQAWVMVGVQVWVDVLNALVFVHTTVTACVHIWWCTFCTYVCTYICCAIYACLHSAGVGRTGTFIAIDAMMQRLQERDDLDIRKFVVQMRTKRTLMVQNLVSTYADCTNLSNFHMCRRLRSVFKQSGLYLRTRFLGGRYGNEKVHSRRSVTISKHVYS